MKSKFCLLPILVSFVILCSCETEPSDSVNIAAKLEGQWKVEEYSSGFKSTNDFYFVTIEIHQSDSNKIIIDNFYDIGVSVWANILGMSIEIPDQTTAENTKIDGSGTISSNYNSINWNYNVDIGDGMVEKVSAMYTRIY